jgi:hypothetical protein
LNRRGFLKMLGGGVAGIAIAEAVPLGRVRSFPKVLKLIGIDLAAGESVTAVSLVRGNVFLTTEYVTMEYLRVLKNKLRVAELMRPTAFDREFAVGDVITVNMPALHQVQVVDRLPFVSCSAYSGGPPARPPVIQLKSPLVPFAPALGMPES